MAKLWAVRSPYLKLMANLPQMKSNAYQMQWNMGHPFILLRKHLTQGNAIFLGFLPEFLVNNDPLKREATWFWQLCEQEDIKRLQQRAAVLLAAARVPQSLSPHSLTPLCVCESKITNICDFIWNWIVVLDLI